MNDRQFRLGTTSFIVPDHIIPNVEKLGPWFDEIELLVFESRPDYVLPTPEQVQTLAELSHRYDLTYNVHLPVDVSLSSGSREDLENATRVLLEVLDLLKPLGATTHTLHLEMPASIDTDPLNKSQVNKWIQTLDQTLSRFLSGVADPETLSIETLAYPFSLVQDLVERHSLPVCIDIGHGIKYGYDWLNIARTCRTSVPLVHLHGVDFSGPKINDHVSLDRLPEAHLSQVLSFLKTFSGVVSLEVFNFENLSRSLELLGQHYKDIPLPDNIL